MCAFMMHSDVQIIRMYVKIMEKINGIYIRKGFFKGFDK